MQSESTQSALDMRIAFVIDDEADIRQLVATTLAEHGFKIEIFKTANTALAGLGNNHPAVIFLDVALLQSDAIDVLTGLGARRYCSTVHVPA